MKTISYGLQFIDNKDVKSLAKSLKQKKITTGPSVENFETKIKKYVNSKYALVCNSGTSAIYLALKAIDLKKDDIIIMPAINFIASYNISKMFKTKIYLADIDEKTGQVTPEKIIECCKRYKIKKIKAVIVMYYGGYPQNADKFIKLKKKFGCKIIEDACHAFGAKYFYSSKTYKIGSCKHCDISTFSFHPLKSITTGEGGAVTTNSKELNNKMKRFRSHGIERNKKKHWEYEIKSMGLNFRLTDFQSELGISQLRKLNRFLKKRELIANYYNKNLSSIKQIELPDYNKNYISSNHLYVIQFKNFTLKKKNLFLKYMLDKKILLQYHYIPIYKFGVFNGKYINYNSEKFYKKSVSLPIHFSLTKKDQNYIINNIKSYFKSK